MLLDVAGLGHWESLKATFATRGDQCRLDGSYRTENGSSVECELLLRTHPDPPRPAGYCLNGHAVERSIRLPEYQLQFAGDGRQVDVTDPLALLTQDFVARLQQGQWMSSGEIMAGMNLLTPIMQAAHAGFAH